MYTLPVHIMSGKTIDPVVKKTSEVCLVQVMLLKRLSGLQSQTFDVTP